jgi:REP-associated tyrosine transposase
VPRPTRPQIAGGFYHVVARGVAGTPIVLDDVDRDALIQLLRRTEAKYGWRIHAFCLMTTHVHAVIETPDANVSKGLHWLLSIYAQRFNRRWGRFGHLFADRFTSRVIDTEEYLEEACRYVLDNPVKAGLCESRMRWRWSGGLAFEAMGGGLTPHDSAHAQAAS